jgi:hypothetical protein
MEYKAIDLVISKYKGFCEENRNESLENCSENS